MIFINKCFEIFIEIINNLGVLAKKAGTPFSIILKTNIS